MIPLSKPSIGAEEIKNVTDTIKNGYLSQGSQVEAFEQRLSKFLGVDKENIIATNSGTSSLHLAIILLSEKLSYQVVHVPATTFIATANTISHLDKEDDTTITFDDIEPDTWNAIPKDGYKITVDLFGNSCQYNYLKDVLIEDAAEAFGSEYNGKKCGTLADFGIFSFFENKTITTGGEGGAVYAKNRKDADKIRLLRQQGKNYSMEFHADIGFNYRMTEIQAAFGLAQLNRIDNIVKIKMSIHSLYKELLQDNVQFQREIGIQCPWLTCVKFNSKIKRDKSKELLKRNGVQTRLPFPPVYYNPPYNGNRGYCPVAENLYDTGLCLPNYPELKDEQVKMISRTIEQAVNETKV